MPRQNRPVVRDGRLQASKKKRTDRSYLRQPETAPPPPAPVEDVEPVEVDKAPVAEAAPAEAVPAEPEVRERVRVERAQPVAERRAPTATAARPIAEPAQRKRREVDLQALAVADTRYAMHELRRIAILATMVIITLIVLAIVLR